MNSKSIHHFLTLLLRTYSASVIPTLSLGLSISSPHLSSDELDSFLRRMLASRISRRVLAEHHLELTRGLEEKEGSKNFVDNVGIIFTGLNVKRSLDKYIKVALSSVHESDRLRSDSKLQEHYKLPDIVVDGQVDATFSYIREHLEYILLELLLNVSIAYSLPFPSDIIYQAVRATAIQLHDKPDLIPGTIRATISSDDDEVYVRISDQGISLMSKHEYST